MYRQSLLEIHLKSQLSTSAGFDVDNNADVIYEKIKLSQLLNGT